jgi:hypothetical protein
MGSILIGELHEAEYNTPIEATWTFTLADAGDLSLKEHDT